MHVFIIFIDFRGVSFTRKSRESFLKHVNSQWLIGGYQNINSQIEFMAINKQRVCDVSGDNWKLINIDIIDIVYQRNALPLGRICRLHNPDILLAVVLLQFLVMLIELSELIRENVGIGNKVKVLLSETFLHPNNIKAQSIFSCDFMALGEMVDLLVLV